jgi:hypothetical protein
MIMGEIPVSYEGAATKEHGSVRKAVRSYNIH